MYSSVLIPLDGSESAEAAVEEALRMAPAVKNVHLLLVENPVVKAYHLEGYTMYVDHIVSMRIQSGKEYLQPFKERLEAAGVAVTAAVRFGDPVKSVAEAAKEFGADLILLGGEEGNWFWRHTGLAGLAPRLSRRVAATVLVVREPAEREKNPPAAPERNLQAA